MCSINYLCTCKFNGPVCYFFRRPFFITRGNGPWNSRLFGAREIARAVRRVRFGTQKSREFQGPFPSIENGLPEKITHRAVKFIGA